MFYPVKSIFGLALIFLISMIFERYLIFWFTVLRHGESKLQPKSHEWVMQNDKEYGPIIAHNYLVNSHDWFAVFKYFVYP